MPFLIGTDEAGYGPNLGPLTITGSLWETPSIESDLFELLNDVVKPTAGRGDNRLFIADSKQVYRGSITAMELSVLSLATWIEGKVPSSVEQLCSILCPSLDWNSVREQEWYDFESVVLPIKAGRAKILEFAARFGDAADRAGVRLLGIEAVAVLPPEFNRQVADLGNKATLLSHQTLGIAKRLMQRTDDDLEIICDKHGGRSKYARILETVLTDQSVSIGQEAREESDYSFREDHRDIVVRFRAGGETFLPTAVASLVSKYLRELFMEGWNQFWLQHVADIKPTKGYPVDAKRFKDEIEAAQHTLQIANDDIWRVR